MTAHRGRRRPRTIARALGTVLLALSTVAVGATWTSAGATQSGSSTAEARGRQTVQVPVSFEVRNVNRSKVACASDGKTYTVRGHLVGPANALNNPKKLDAATLYLHGLSFGEFFWNFQQATDYNYAEAQARRGNVSVVVDRLGYVSSDKPDGFGICVGSRADIAHQMVLALRSGGYDADGHTGPAFAKVALAGHSYGGQIAQVEAYSFGDIDGLIVVGYADRVQSALLKSNATYAAQVCSTGGLRVGGVGPAGYAPFGPPEGALAALFNSAPQRVQLAAKQLLTIDPCGDTASFDAATQVDLANVQRITVPVLIVAGGADKLFPPPAGPDQAALFTGSSSVTQVTLPNTAHAITFEAGHDQFVKVVDSWLNRYVERR